MKITIYAKKIKITPQLRNYLEEKLNKLDRYLSNIIEAWVEVDEDLSQQGGNKYRTEVQLRIPKDSIRAQHTGTDIYETIDLVIPKLKKQIEKYKTRFREAKRKKFINLKE